MSFHGCFGFAFACDRGNNVRHTPIFPLQFFPLKLEEGKDLTEGEGLVLGKYQPQGLPNLT